MTTDNIILFVNLWYDGGRDDILAVARTRFQCWSTKSYSRRDVLLLKIEYASLSRTNLTWLLGSPGFKSGWSWTNVTNVISNSSSAAELLMWCLTGHSKQTGYIVNTEWHKMQLCLLFVTQYLFGQAKKGTANFDLCRRRSKSKHFIMCLWTLPHTYSRLGYAPGVKHNTHTVILQQMYIITFNQSNNTWYKYDMSDTETNN